MQKQLFILMMLFASTAFGQSAIKVIEANNGLLNVSLTRNNETIQENGSNISLLNILAGNYNLKIIRQNSPYVIGKKDVDLNVDLKPNEKLVVTFSISPQSFDANASTTTEPYQAFANNTPTPVEPRAVTQNNEERTAAKPRGLRGLPLMSDQDFNGLYNAVNSKPWDNEAFDVAVAGTKYNSFTTEQIRLLLSTFGIGSFNEKYSFLVHAFPKIVDKQNAYKLEEPFTFSHEKEKARAFLASQ